MELFGKKRRDLFFVWEGVGVGGQQVHLKATLMVYFNLICREQKRTEDNLDAEVRVLFFTISAKMERIHRSSFRKGFVLIDHYTSRTGQWKHLAVIPHGCYPGCYPAWLLSRMW